MLALGSSDTQHCIQKSEIGGMFEKDHLQFMNFSFVLCSPGKGFPTVRGKGMRCPRVSYHLEQKSAFIGRKTNFGFALRDSPRVTQTGFKKEAKSLSVERYPINSHFSTVDCEDRTFRTWDTF